MNKTITLQALIEAVNNCGVVLEVAVRDDDYYAKQGATTFHTIKYVDFQALVEELRGML